MRMVMLAVALMLSGLWVGPVVEHAEAANEARCTELGANCVCSEPLNTSTYTALTAFYFDPTDTTVSDKECTRAGPSFPGAVIEDGAGFVYVPVTSGEMLAALPAGHLAGLKVLRTKTTAEGNSDGGGNFLGTKFPGGAPTARRSFRVYFYYSPTYQLTTVPVCDNSAKVFQFGNEPNVGAVLSGSGGDYLLYGWVGFNVNSLCCVRGPGSDYTGYTESNIRGKWFRYELVITNTMTSGPTTTIKIYMKQITDNLPERTIIDTTVPTTQPVDENWTSTKATTLKPTAGDIVDLWVDAFRNGTCAGYQGFSHLLFAAWDTDAGQRIGPASEVEGSTIASHYTRDAGIETDPAVIYSQKFEGTVASWSSQFNGGGAGGISNSTDVPTASAGTRSAALLPVGSQGQLYRGLGATYTDLYYRAYVKWLGNISDHSGIEIGGYSDENGFPQGDAGIKGTRPNGQKLFVADFQQRGAPTVNSPNTRLDFYNNWIDMHGTGCCGPPTLYFGEANLVTENVPLNVNQWQCVEIHVQLNSTAGGHEGKQELWINDTLMQSLVPGSPVGAFQAGTGNWITGAGSAFPGWQWRDTLTYGINWIKMSNYSTATTATPLNVLYDDLVVATSRIGCLNAGTADTTPPAAPTGLVITKALRNIHVPFLEERP